MDIRIGILETIVVDISYDEWLRTIMACNRRNLLHSDIVDMYYKRTNRTKKNISSCFYFSHNDKIFIIGSYHSIVNGVSYSFIVNNRSHDCMIYKSCREYDIVVFVATFTIEQYFTYNDIDLSVSKIDDCITINSEYNNVVFEGYITDIREDCVKLGNINNMVLYDLKYTNTSKFKKNTSYEGTSGSPVIHNDKIIGIVCSYNTIKKTIQVVPIYYLYYILNYDISFDTIYCNGHICSIQDDNADVIYGLYVDDIDNSSTTISGHTIITKINDLAIQKNGKIRLPKLNMDVSISIYIMLTQNIADNISFDCLINNSGHYDNVKINNVRILHDEINDYRYIDEIVNDHHSITVKCSNEFVEFAKIENISAINCPAPDKLTTNNLISNPTINKFVRIDKETKKMSFGRK